MFAYISLSAYNIFGTYTFALMGRVF